jgi:hypothetical protein
VLQVRKNITIGRKVFWHASSPILVFKTVSAILYVTFIDSEKEFDSVKREVMWLTLQEYSIPRKIIQIITILYDRFKCKISHEGKLSEFIEVRNGVRQGCILSPTLFC